MMRTHTCGELRLEHDTQSVTLTGWVKSVRLTGKFAFLDIYDRYGTTQVFIKPNLVDTVKNLNQEDVIQINGTVKGDLKTNVKVVLQTLNCPRAKLSSSKKCLRYPSRLMSRLKVKKRHG